MTTPDLIATLRRRHDDTLNRATQMLDDAEAAGRGLTPEQRTEHDALLTDVSQLASRIDELATQQTRQSGHNAAQQRHGGQPAHVTREPATYSPETAREGRSLIVDLYHSQRGNRIAAERIDRHQREAADFTATRDVATSAFGGLVPPQYLLEEFAPLARAGRPIANAVRSAPLPASGMALVIPRGTTGATTAVQTTQNTAVAMQDYAETDLTLPVATIAGQQNLSRQSLERGQGIDAIIFADLAADYAVKLNQQVISGSGAAGQLLGLLSLPGVNQVTYTDTTPTVGKLWPKIADAIQRINSARFMPATFLAMTPARWGWISAAADSTGRPLFNFSSEPNAAALSPIAVGVAAQYGQVVGMVQGLPVITDAGIPTNLGTGANEDRILVVRGGAAGDAILFEDGDGLPKQLRFEDTIAGSLTVKLVVYGYSAFTAGRYPNAVSVISGSGLATPGF